MAVPFSNTKLRVPRGFQNILEGLAREVLRAQPTDIQVFSAAYFERLLKVRAESGIDPAVHGAQLEDRFYNNKAFEKPDIDASSHEQQDAAVAIQTKYRQHHASQVVQDKREDKAAIKIQAGFRGYQDRCKVKQLKEARTSTGGRETEEEVDIDLEDPEVEAAAFKIQAGFKNYKSRKSSKPSEEEPAAAAAEEEKIDIDLEDPEVQKAATKIQAGFKGYKARKDADILKGEKGDKPEEGEEEGKGDAEAKDEADGKEEKAEEIDIDLDDPEVEAAAVKIQESFKSFKARKESHVPADGAEGEKEAEGEVKEEGDKKEEEEIDIDLKDPEVEAAAVKIQASYKSFKSRKESRVGAEGEMTVDAEGEGEKEGDAKDDAEGVKKEAAEEEIDIDLNDPEVEKAATKIQAGFKGYKARKSLKEPGTEETGTEEPATEEPGTEETGTEQTEVETKGETEGEAKGETEGEGKGETEGEVKGETKDEAEDPAKE